MYFTKALALLVLSSTGLSYVVELYDSAGCNPGNFIEEVNVYDNTCSTGHSNIQAFKPKAYGHSHQRATFYKTKGCSTLCQTWSHYWADGGEQSFHIDECHDLKFPANALGSSRG